MSAQKIGTGHRGRARWRRDGSLWTIYGGMDGHVHLDHRHPDGTLFQAFGFDAGMSGHPAATLSELCGPDLWEDDEAILWVAWRVDIYGQGYGQLWNQRDAFVIRTKELPVWSSNPWAFGDGWIGWQAPADRQVYASPLTDLSRVERLGPGDPMGLSRLTAQPSGVPAFLVYPSESYSFPDGPWLVRHLGGGKGCLTTHELEPTGKRQSFNGQDANQPWIAGHPDGVHAAIITHGSGDGVRIDCFTRADLVPVPPPQPTPKPPIPKPKPPIPIPPEPVPVPPEPVPPPISRWRRRPMFALAPFDNAVVDRFEKRLQPGGDLAASVPYQISGSVIETMKVEFIYYITSLAPVPPGDWTAIEKDANDHMTKLWFEGLPNP